MFYKYLLTCKKLPLSFTLTIFKLTTNKRINHVVNSILVSQINTSRSSIYSFIRNLFFIIHAFRELVKKQDMGLHY